MVATFLPWQRSSLALGVPQARRVLYIFLEICFLRQLGTIALHFVTTELRYLVHHQQIVRVVDHPGPSHEDDTIPCRNNFLLASP